MSTTRMRGRRPNRVAFSTTVWTDVDVDVDIDADELHDEGWHHQDECKHGCVHPEQARLDAAVDDFHRQLHGEYPARVCTTEPCRSLYLMPLESVAS